MDCPASLKPISHYLKAAQEHETRDIVVAYWCRIYALQMGLKLSSNLPEETKVLIGKCSYSCFSLVPPNQYLLHRHHGLAGND